MTVDDPSCSGDANRVEELPFYPLDMTLINDLSRFYLNCQRRAQNVQLQRIGYWSSFSPMIASSLKHLDCRRARDVKYSNETALTPNATAKEIDAILRHVCFASESILQENNIPVEFSRFPSVSQIAWPSMSVFLKNEAIKTPILIGLHFTDSELPDIKDDRKMAVGSLIPGDVKRGSDRIIEVCRHLLLNNTQFGYITTGTFTRFVRMVPTNGLAVEISPLVTLRVGEHHSLLDALISVAYQSWCDYQSPGLLNKLSFTKSHEIDPETLPEPAVYSLQRGEPPVPGKAKWWRIKRNRDQCFLIDIKSHLEDTGASMNTSDWNTKFGTIHISPRRFDKEEAISGAQEDGLPFPVLIKCCNFQSKHAQDAYELLYREASFYEYLSSCKLSHAPRRYVYGEVLGFLKVLVLEPIGRPMTLSDVNESTLESMLLALRELHDKCVLHGDVKLENFFINDFSEVRIANFGKSRRYRNLYQRVKDAELAIVDDIGRKRERGQT